MKTTQIKKAALLTFAIAALAGSAGVVSAGETPMPKEMVAKIISLPASNGAPLTVTIWTPRTKLPCCCEPASARKDTAKVIGLPAANGPAVSVTVWTSGASENTFEVAPLK